MKKIVRSARNGGLNGEKRQRLIEAAIGEFNEYGPDNASYNRIIERSGLSKGSVYYYFDNKEALLDTVMEEIEAQVLEAVAERPLPQTREEFWEALYGYRQREVDFFAQHPALGRVLLVSLGDREFENLDEAQKGLCPPLARLLRRHVALIRRGQELGAIREDLDINLIFGLIRSVDRALCIHLFGRDVWFFETLSDEERKVRSQEYLRLFEDLTRRLFEPPMESS